MPNAKPPSMLRKTSEEPSQSAIRISLLTHTNAINHVLQLKTFDMHRAQRRSPPVRFSHLHLHQQLLTGNYHSWVSPSNSACHGGKQTLSAWSPGLAVLLCTLPALPSKGCPCGGSDCVPAVAGERGGITVSLAGSGVPGWREGGTMGMGTSPESPVPSVQCITPARSLHTAIYNRTASMALSTAVQQRTLLCICSTG